MNELSEEKLNEWVKIYNNLETEVYRVCKILNIAVREISYIDKKFVSGTISYQECDYDDDFEFPTKLLLKNKEEILEYKEEQSILRIKREEQRRIDAEKQQVEKEKKRYLILKEKYENEAP